MRIGLLGGTFNPVHNGHLFIGETAREKYRLDRVIFVPAGRPPHKKMPRTSAQDRLRMLRAALHGHPAFQVSDWEIRQKRVVYTVETLEHFRQVWPRAALYFIGGSDSMKSLPRWRDAKRLPSLARWVSLPRELPFASREIRRRVRNGLSIRYQVPEGVRRYIRAHRLYRRPE